MQKVDEIEEAYTGEEPKLGSICFMPKLNFAVTVQKMSGSQCIFYVNNGAWEGAYDKHSKKWRIQDEEADYLMAQSHHLSANDHNTRVFIDPWRDAGNMMEIDVSMLSAKCRNQWYL